MKNSFGNCQQQTSRKGSTFVSNRTVGHIRPKIVVRNEWGTKRDADFPRQLMGLMDTVVVQLLSHVWLLATPWTAAHQASLSFTISLSLLKLMSTELMIPSNHLILCHPLLLLSSILPSIKVFSSELALRIRWPKYWSFSFSNRPTNEYSGLISFRIDWFDLFAVQRTPKSLLQHHNLCVDITNVFLVTLPMPSLSSFTY